MQSPCTAPSLSTRLAPPSTICTRCDRPTTRWHPLCLHRHIFGSSVNGCNRIWASAMPRAYFIRSDQRACPRHVRSPVPPPSYLLSQCTLDSDRDSQPVRPHGSQRPAAHAFVDGWRPRRPSAALWRRPLYPLRGARAAIWRWHSALAARVSVRRARGQGARWGRDGGVHAGRRVAGESVTDVGSPSRPLNCLGGGHQCKW
ncbi:hypothetical protein FA95DRAFT_528958 [Auriscalpium vulgare]|uniref:Uncharacterized protein n=1 Tax=Auriscalpium vulgare TaxID=40419 RepID=A0ACB8S2X4_9AGAM|nr:hypothetical protein FA95DRAFT_528958 [Auriscalpium vulgare]